MTKATKKKLESLNSTLNVLGAETEKKQKWITYLLIGVAGLAVIVFFVVFMRKRRG